MNYFERWVSRRWQTQQPTTPVGRLNVLHPVPYPMVAALGFAGESGEVMECLKKHYRDGTHPGKSLLLELGDVLHYLTVIGQSYGWTLEEIQEANIEKLIARDAESKT
jgi:NTP pyrophosphatase (non-canonical NTP hydrolase)